MGKTYKDRPDKYFNPKIKKPKEKRFESSKGRQKENLKKELELDYDYKR